jgi:hypothetical protein
MNTFKRKALFTAVVAGLGVSGTAEAVYLNPNGTGQVLVYPYYTVQSVGGSSWNTYISVVNTTSSAKAVKVRVLEGKTSAEVLDFNLFLSPNDVWVAAIGPTDATSGSAGRLFAPDTSCTAPTIPLGGAEFRNYQYSSAGNGSNLPGVGLDRTREGYIEIIEMATLSGAVAGFVTHSLATGIPANCPAVQGTAYTPTIGERNPPTGGLMGTGTLINVGNGQDAGYKADALEAWSNVQQYTVPTSVSPNLGDATPAVSLVINAGTLLGVPGASMGITAFETDFGLLQVSLVPAGARAVASVYMHTAVMNEYILDTATQSNTDWVVTQPLKNLFVNNLSAATPYTALLTATGACETISFTYFDRDERSATANPGDFSPTPPGAPANAICWESNVLSIRNGAAHTTAAGTVSGVLGSINVTNVGVTSTFQNGWGMLSFAGANASPAGSIGMAGAIAAASFQVRLNQTAATAPVVLASATTFYGLPVTGFMVRNFRNGNIPGGCPAPAPATGTVTCQGNYGSLFNHSYRNVIRP